MSKEQVREQIADELGWLSDFMLKCYGLPRRETRRIARELIDVSM